jgi:hypothetical protein
MLVRAYSGFLDPVIRDDCSGGITAQALVPKLEEHFAS